MTQQENAYVYFEIIRRSVLEGMVNKLSTEDLIKSLAIFKEHVLVYEKLQNEYKNRLS